MQRWIDVLGILVVCLGDWGLLLVAGWVEAFGIYVDGTV